MQRAIFFQAQKKKKGKKRKRQESIPSCPFDLLTSSPATILSKNDLEPDAAGFCMDTSNKLLKSTIKKKQQQYNHKSVLNCLV